MLTLSQDQQDIIDDVVAFLNVDGPGEMVITGQAGTGKTTITKEIISATIKLSNMLQMLFDSHKQRVNIVLTSTTNKAAKVLSEATGIESGTIHSYLNLRVYNDYSTGMTKLQATKATEIIKNTLLIVDEASMVDTALLKMIREKTQECKVIYIGDRYQLAPVFEAHPPVFNQIMNQKELTTVHRQATGSSIVPFATQYRQVQDGVTVPFMAELGNEVKLLNKGDFEQQVISHYTQDHEVNDLRILAWTNKRVHQYNAYIRNLLKPGQKDYQVGEYLLTNQPVLEGSKIAFSTDAIVRVTHIEPDERHDIKGWSIELNGGPRVFQAYNRLEVEALLKYFKKHKDWYKFFDIKESCADLRPVHSCTVNKSQGSTYKTVFIDLDDIAACTQDLQIMRMMYTAVTRASDMVYIRGALPARILGGS